MNVHFRMNIHSSQKNDMQTDLASAVKRAPERDRRQEILAAAERAFVRHGFHAATMLHVAEEAGMSAGNLYRYFPGKEALVEGLCTMDSEERAANFAMLARSPKVFDAIAFGLRQHLLAKPPRKSQNGLGNLVGGCPQRPHGRHWAGRRRRYQGGAV